MNENLDKNICFDGELLTSYIYGELNDSAVKIFDDHLLDCHHCQNEFSTFSDARLSVFEWHKFEFEPLATPQINIQYGTSGSWLKTFWESFVVPHRWPVTAASFAAIAVMFGTTFLMLSGTNNTFEIASSNKTKIESMTAAKTEEPKSIPSFEPAVENEPKTLTGDIVKPEVVAISTKPQEPHLKSQKRNFNNRTTQPTSVPPSMAVGLNTPVRLNNFEESQDDSPRLSDLFDETEAS